MASRHGATRPEDDSHSGEDGDTRPLECGTWRQLQSAAVLDARRCEAEVPDGEVERGACAEGKEDFAST
jgi:hypothetical protein